MTGAFFTSTDPGRWLLIWPARTLPGRWHERPRSQAGHPARLMTAVMTVLDDGEAFPVAAPALVAVAA